MIMLRDKMMNMSDLSDYCSLSSRISNTKVSNKLNLGKGSLLEDLVKSVLGSTGFNVEPHYIWQSGCDVKANLGNKTMAGECISWYGGFVHPIRWNSITNNLMESRAKHKLFICFGAKPTKAQYKDAESKNIIVIHYPRQMDIYDEDNHSLINWLELRILTITGVITSVLTDVIRNVLGKIKLFSGFVVGHVLAEMHVFKLVFDRFRFKFKCKSLDSMNPNSDGVKNLNINTVKGVIRRMKLKLKCVLTSFDGVHWILGRVYYLCKKDNKDSDSDFLDAEDFKKYHIIQGETMLKLDGIGYEG